MLHAKFLGRVPYQEALEIQMQYWQKALTEGEAYVLGLDHRAVITLGKRGNLLADVYAPKELLAARGVELVETDRGGQATLHSENQLVVYPILPLRKMGMGVREFVGALESSTMEWLQNQGIQSRVGEDEPGIYTDHGKIAFFGIRVERGVTRHGISINIANDLTLFELIRSCGKSTEKFDSLSLRGSKLSLQEHYQNWFDVFRKNIERLTLKA